MEWNEMKGSTIAIVGVGAAVALYMLSKQSSSSGGGGTTLLGSLGGGLGNLASAGENLTGSLEGATKGLEDLMKSLSSTGAAVGTTVTTMAETGTMAAQTVKNVVSVPQALSQTYSNAGVNVAQFLNNLPTYATKNTDLTKPLDGVVKKLTHLW